MGHPQLKNGVLGLALMEVLDFGIIIIVLMHYILQVEVM